MERYFMFKIIYAVVEERMPEGFVDNLVFAKDEYEMIVVDEIHVCKYN